MRIEEVFEIIRKISPEELQEDWDNSGIQICFDKSADVKRIMTALEISDAVIDEAIERKADLIVTHHPLIFGKINKVDSNLVIGNQIIRLISHGISVYSSHTAFDSALRGTNQYLAEGLGLQNVVPMYPSDMPGCGMGRTGAYDDSVPFYEFIKKIKETCGRTDIRIAGKAPKNVQRVALCTGAGSEFIRDAKKMNCDVYVTGDVKYHDARLADDMDFCVIDAGHYGTEVIFADNMCELLTDAIGDHADIFPSETDIYPFTSACTDPE